MLSPMLLSPGRRHITRNMFHYFFFCHLLLRDGSYVRRALRDVVTLMID